jgi:energy-coupling factor transporter ATP-binding protein EcfA2
MGIDEVLADKQPIIEELTLRLRAVAEGSREAGSGLGLKIVTVQIKEAVVSSTRLWQNLQMPFRAERERLARMAALETERQIAERELEIRKAREMAEIATQRELHRERAEQEREAAERAHEAEVRRTTLEQEAARNAEEQRRSTEQARRKGELAQVLEEQQMSAQRVEAELATLAEQRRLEEAEAARQRAQAEHRLALAELESAAGSAVTERDLQLYEKRRGIDNALSENQVKSQLVAALPEIASRLPAPKELRSVSISGEGAGSSAALTGLLAGLMSLVESAGAKAREG